MTKATDTPVGTTKILAKWTGGHLSVSDCVDWAVNALDSGFDCPNLRILAGYPSSIAFSEVDATLRKAIAELQIVIPDQDALLRAYARQIAQDLIAQKIGTQECLDLIHEYVVTPLEHPVDLMQWCYLWEGNSPETFENLEGDRLAEAVHAQACQLLASDEDVSS